MQNFMVHFYMITTILTTKLRNTYEQNKNFLRRDTALPLPASVRLRHIKRCPRQQIRLLL